MEARHLGGIYRRRWTIEACFQSLKSRGFDLERTHLKDLTKLKKLVALVSMAFAMCGSLGIHQFFRHGLNTIREMLKKDEKTWQSFTTKFIRWLNHKLSLPTENFSWVE